MQENARDVAPFTEQSSPLTLRLSSCGAGARVARLLRAADAQIFAGCGHAHASLSDASVRGSLARAAQKCARVLRDPNGIVVISGSGTSGRLAFMVSAVVWGHGASARCVERVPAGEGALDMKCGQRRDNGSRKRTIRGWRRKE